MARGIRLLKANQLSFVAICSRRVLRTLDKRFANLPDFAFEPHSGHAAEWLITSLYSKVCLHLDERLLPQLFRLPGIGIEVGAAAPTIGGQQTRFDLGLTERKNLVPPLSLNCSQQPQADDNVNQTKLSSQQKGL